ncbi:Uncharacterized protein APZ42_002131, partial [Daphnia magna]
TALKRQPGFEHGHGGHIGSPHMGDQAAQALLPHALLGGGDQQLRRAPAAELGPGVEETEETVARGQMQGQLGIVHRTDRAGFDIELGHHRLATQQDMDAAAALQQTLGFRPRLSGDLRGRAGRQARQISQAGEALIDPALRQLRRRRSWQGLAGEAKHLQPAEQLESEERRGREAARAEQERQALIHAAAVAQASESRRTVQVGRAFLATQASRPPIKPGLNNITSCSKDASCA